MSDTEETPPTLEVLDERLQAIELMQAEAGYGERTCRIEAYARVLAALEGAYACVSSTAMLDTMDTIAVALKTLALEDCDVEPTARDRV